TARNTATVRSRVDGLLTQILFREGQAVKAGDVLAQIDPRPYQVALDQARGQLLRDQALLDNARVDLERYRGLLAKDSIAKQQVDAQVALVRQYEGTVLADKGQVDDARLQLSFTKITAPISGRLGLRQVDLGNMVRSSDTTGLVVITETQPITAVFAIPADHLPSVMRRLGAGRSLPVEAWSADGRTALATGKLISVDNQIDTTTGTIKLKAEFANPDNTLFPNQFFNARLVVDTRADVVLVPSAAVQRGSQGSFVYRIDEGLVKVVVVKTGATSGSRVEVLEGVSAGDQVVIDGVDRLREGAKVEVIRPQASGGAAPGAAAATGHGAPAAAGDARRRGPRPSGS
ncbi:MAG: MdtA/MuxA family multidrug efflux RND transporter periplasmic adaptor subunit, partial [Burkholderiaceae bacterium]